MSKANRIHIAYGFHVNLYHSYRGDSPDGAGFGSDIRIIRKILRVLNELNESGIPVKGTWDSDNYFSLQKLLPQYAPDILEDIRLRVKKYGDENILMGYTNGALGAMNEAELTASIEYAVSNPDGSGVLDLFGAYEPIVRPQEVMFSPSQVRVYNRCGVKALCLYYSCIPFDSFRTIVPKLPEREAFNPLTYHYGDESITVIPTYSNADVCDAGCLRSWVKKLRKKQESGEIDSDLFLFINMDADAIFWETLDLPLIGGKLANTDGIHGLVREVADLDYIVFDTPGGYLKTHRPIGHISFGQDTADGNFTGFSSWAEKPYNRKIWTAVERSRALSRAHGKQDKDCASFHDRLVLLSTTHFGLATPVLNIVREQKADELAQKVIRAETVGRERPSALTLTDLTGSRLQCVQLSMQGVPENETVALSGEGLTDYAVIRAKNGTAFALMRFAEVRSRHTLNVKTVRESAACDRELCLRTDRLTVKFSRLGGITEIHCGEKRIGGKDFLKSFLTYDGKKVDFQILGVYPVPVSGSGKDIRIEGSVHLPGEKAGGSFRYDFFTVPFSQAIYIKSEVSYPFTEEHDSLSTENSALGRFTDNRWTECVPFQLTPRLGNDLTVLKRSFDGEISSFRVSSFIESDPENKTLSSFNHQLTGGFTGLSGDGTGLLFAVSRQVLNSMACCPMRLYADGSVSMNPFGTYFGKQRHHFSMSNNEIQNAYTLIAAQGRSLAPAYNGVSETSLNALFGFEGELPDEKTLSEVTAFSDGCIIEADEGCPVQPFSGDNALTKKPVSPKGKLRLRSPVLYGIRGNLGKYAVYGFRAIRHILHEQRRAK